MSLPDAEWKVLLIGQVATNRDPELAIIGGASGNALAGLAGLPLISFITIFRPINLLPKWNGAKAGDDPPPGEMLLAADALAPTLAARRVVILGRAVAAAFGISARTDFLWRWNVRGMNALLFPHPMGVKRWFDSRQQRADAEAAIRAEVAWARSARTGD